ncbi:MAG: DNA recombination protein RmuC [Flavobacteriaceae bacterium]|nr:DNA recombination protein RmuC [Flavobacteriaceae bacterium]|tara:strand:+ start:3584 stop:4705 length:1122 start_codon:yes stop_codon:yes gene_type:complete
MTLEIVIVFLSLLILFLIYLVYNLKKNTNSNLTTDLIRFSETLTNQIQDVRKEIDSNSKESRTEIESKLKEINKQIHDFTKSSATNMTNQFDKSNKVIRDVTSELEKIKGTNEQVLSFANQMKTLEKILGNQKQRGIFGEMQLENLLANVLPPELYHMQYSFKNSESVDAIVRVNEYIIPIDAKFSLDNYNKMIESSNKDELEDLEKKFKSDIKNRIDETAKYIRPNEGTVDYAYMFIPADGLYQDLLNSRVGSLKINQQDLVSYAFQKKVMIVSPMSLFPMLQVTNKALNNMKIEDSINDVLKNVEKLSNHLNAYKTYHEKLGNTLGTAVNHYNDSSKEFKKIDKDVIKISSGNSQINIQTEIVDKPKIENE